MVDDDERRTDERGNDPSRVLTLTDGVFAIILTLLVLELQVPELARDQTLGDALREVRPSFVAFVISFVVVAIAWAGHRDLFSRIRRADRAVVWLNILHLFPLCIVPFGASLIARYDNDAVALEMYGMLLVAITGTRLGIWWYTTGRPQLLFAAVDARTRRAATVIMAIQGVAYAIAIAIASRATTASLLIYAAVPALYFIALWLVRPSRLAGPGEQHGE